ncbi:unknown [Firmicutes bacterium CAG:582]|nr:unknown [Firmicutes bacterium CAG:582]
MPNLILVFIDVLKNIQTEKDYNEFITLLKELCLNDEIIFELVSNEEKLDLEKENKYFQLFYSLDFEGLKEYLKSLKEIYIIPKVYFVDELDYLVEITNILRANECNNVLSFYKTNFHKSNSKL